MALSWPYDASLVDPVVGFTNPLVKSTIRSN